MTFVKKALVTLPEAMHAFLVVFIASFFFSPALPDVFAQTIITVSSTGDCGAGTLRQAVLDAAAGDKIVFSLDSTDEQTITLGSELVIDKDLTIDGANGKVRISGNNRQ